MLWLSFVVQAGDVLQFNKQGKFKIVQLTDVHLKPALTDGMAQTAATMKSVVSAENPDLVVVTGDIVHGKPALTGWNLFLDVMNSLKVPFAVVMGNHDAETMSKPEIYALLATSPYFVGEPGPKEIFGMGNYVLPVISAKDASKPAALVYCIDSNDYTHRPNFSYYDWIHHDQIGWYREQSQKYTALNGGKPLPALAYFHIPTPEFGMAKLSGQFGAPIATFGYNSGFIANAADMGDIFGCFVGHAHNNDVVGVYNGMLLGFGRCTGASAYGEVVRGGRVVEITEGERTMETWVTTPKGREGVYYFPSTVTSDEERDLPYFPAVAAKTAGHGVKYTYYEGMFEKISDIKPENKKGEGVLENFIISKAPAQDHFAYDFETLIDIPERAVYIFTLGCDDGAVLYVDGKLLADNNGLHSGLGNEVHVALEKGLHRLKVRYFEDYMGEWLNVSITSRKITMRSIPSEMLYVEK